MAHATALKHIFMEQMRTAEVHAWTAIAQLAQKRSMATAVLALADPPLMSEACAKSVELESFPPREATTAQVALKDKFQKHQVVPHANPVHLELTKPTGNSAMHAYEAKFPQKAVLLAVHVMQGVSPRRP